MGEIQELQDALRELVTTAKELMGAVEGKNDLDVATVRKALKAEIAWSERILGDDGEGDEMEGSQV